MICAGAQQRLMNAAALFGRAPAPAVHRLGQGADKFGPWLTYPSTTTSPPSRTIATVIPTSCHNPTTSGSSSMAARIS